MKLLIALLITLAAFTGAHGASADARYVVLAHGWDGWNSTGELGVNSWNTFRPLLIDAGFTPVVVSLGNDNVVNSQIIRDAVNSLPTGSEVHVVGHSMGGLSARLYMKNYGGAARVTTYVSLDTPQYGGAKAWYMNWQMLPGSPFLTALNSGDPTPGLAPYVQLTAEYTQLLPGVHYAALPGVTHREAVTDYDTLQFVIRILNGDYTGLQTN